MLRRILVVLEGTRFTPWAIRLAVELAGRHGARVTGLVALDRRRLENVGPIPAGASIYAERLRAHRIGVRRQAMAGAVRAFREASDAAGVRYEVVEDEGNGCELVASLSRYYDLTVLGLRGFLECQVGAEHSEASQIRLLGSGIRPVLAVAGEPRPIRRVLVAYDGSAGAAQAMACFLHLRPWPDVRVRIVTCQDSQREGLRLLMDAAEYCRAHGWEPETRCVSGPPGREVLAEANRWNADLVVAGSGTRSLLRRRCIGKTALHLMRYSGRPLFLCR